MGARVSYAAFTYRKIRGITIWPGSCYGRSNFVKG